MKVTTNEVSAALIGLTRVNLVQERMVDLLFPAVSTRAECLKRAALMVIADKSSTLPVLTQLIWIIVKKMRLAPEVLPIVGILALCLVVFDCHVWAPLCFEVVHVKVGIFRIFVNEAGLEIVLRVSKRTDLPILTILEAVRAEGCLVLLNMIKSFSVAVRHVTLISQFTSPTFVIFAKVCRVHPILSSAIKLRVIVLAHLILVHASNTAFHHFKHLKIQVQDFLTIDVSENVEKATHGA